VLTLREAELDSRLKDRERLNTLLEAQIQELKVELRKERATQEAQLRHIATLEDQLSARVPRRRPTRPLAKAVTAKSNSKPRRAGRLRKRANAGRPTVKRASTQMHRRR
jgi:hypothetical protein